MSQQEPVVYLPGEGVASDGGGLRYGMILFTGESVAEGVEAAWQEKVKELTHELAWARMDGKRTLAREISEELEGLFDQFLLPELTRNAGKPVIGGEVARQMVSVIRGSGVKTLAWAVLPSQVHWVFELDGEVAPPQLLDSLKALAPEIPWSRNAYIPLLGDDEAMQLALSRLHALALQAGVAVSRELPDAGATSGQEDAAGELQGETVAAAPEFHHISVLLEETVAALAPAAGKVIIDATLGGGGHSEALLEAGASVIGVDQDPSALRAASIRLARFGERFRTLHANFRDLPEVARLAGIGPVDGLLADIGVSSHQLDTPDRGFSFRDEGPLDMRMNPTRGMSAADIVNSASAEEIADILYQYGEERASRAIARAILRRREVAPFTTTSQLAECIASVLPKTGPTHPATRSFQALRIAVNDELGALDALLEASPDLLARGGRLAIITFHSLEDRRVKQFLDLQSRAEIDRPEWPAPRPNPDYHFKLLFRRPVTASPAELDFNPRARSAKLRAAIRI